MTVVVQGTGTANARPDRAVLLFELGHTAPTSPEALRNVAERTASLEAVLRDRGVAEADWTTAGVTVQPAYEWRRDEHVLLGQRAVNRLQVTTRDAALVGRLLTDAVESAGARVGGPQWVVEQDNPAHLEACRAAAADARRRAQAYADGLGLALGPVVSVDETRPDEPVPRGRMMMAMATAAADESAPLDVSAGDMEVSAQVVVTFTLVPGD